MPRPDFLFVHPLTIKAEYREPAESEWGEYLAEKETVELPDGVSPAREGGVILHETMHVVTDVSNLADHNDEEMFVGLMSEGMWRWWIDNPDWVKHIEALARKVRKGVFVDS